MWEGGILCYQAHEPSQATWSAPNHIIPKCSGEDAAIPQKEIHRKSCWLEYAWEMAHGSFQWASPTHDSEMISSKWLTELLPQAAPSTHQACLCMGQYELLRQPAMLSSAHAQVWERKAISYRGGIAHRASSSAVHGAFSSYTEKSPDWRKKLAPKLGLCVIPIRDSWLFSSSILASETFDLQTFHLLKEEMDQQQGS